MDKNKEETLYLLVFLPHFLTPSLLPYNRLVLRNAEKINRKQNNMCIIGRELKVKGVKEGGEFRSALPSPTFPF